MNQSVGGGGGEGGGLCDPGFIQCSFPRLGQSIGRHPWRYIVGCLVVVGLCGLGLLRFSEVTDPDKLWVPDDADVLTQKAWIEKNFPSSTRLGFLMGVSSNLLTPSGLGAVRARCQPVTFTVSLSPSLSACRLHCQPVAFTVSLSPSLSPSLSACHLHCHLHCQPVTFTAVCYLHCQPVNFTVNLSNSLQPVTFTAACRLHCSLSPSLSVFHLHFSLSSSLQPFTFNVSLSPSSRPVTFTAICHLHCQAVTFVAACHLHCQRVTFIALLPTVRLRQQKKKKSQTYQPPLSPLIVFKFLLSFSCVILQHSMVTVSVIQHDLAVTIFKFSMTLQSPFFKFSMT